MNTKNKRMKRKLKNKCGIQYINKKIGEVDFGKYGKQLAIRNKGKKDISIYFYSKI